jgi:saccharopine dehydrogenase (NAD+, L-lysine forming)
VLDVLAIDNLPSLLPRESSVAFSADLVPYLRALYRRAVAGDGDPVWDRCRTSSAQQ